MDWKEIARISWIKQELPACSQWKWKYETEDKGENTQVKNRQHMARATKYGNGKTTKSYFPHGIYTLRNNPRYQCSSQCRNMNGKSCREKEERWCFAAPHYIAKTWSHVHSRQRTCSSLIWGMGIPIGPMLIEQVPKDNVHVAEMDQWPKAHSCLDATGRPSRDFEQDKYDLSKFWGTKWSQGSSITFFSFMMAFPCAACCTLKVDWGDTCEIILIKQNLPRQMNHQKMPPKIYLDAARGGGWKELGRENWLMAHVLGYDRSPRFHASKTDNVTDMQLLSHSSYNLLFYQSLSTMCVCDFAKKYLLAIWMEAILVAAHFLQSWEVLVSI